MENLIERTLYYSFAIAECTGDHIITVVHKVASLFSCDEHIDDQWDKLIGDETLQKLSSARMIEYWQNYVRSFCNHHTFGERGIENDIMELKKKALILIERGNIYAPSSEQEKNNQLLGEASVLYALLLYINKKPKETYLSVIRKAAEHNIDAIIILMALDSTQRERLLQKLKKDSLSVSNSTYEYLETKFASMYTIQRKVGGN